MASAPISLNDLNADMTSGGLSQPAATSAIPGLSPVLGNTPAFTTPSSGAGAGAGAGSGSSPSLPQDTINAILAGIANHVAQNQQDFNKATAQDAGADAQSNISYNNQNQSNSASHGSAIQNAEQAAAQGNQGLRSILASMGALGGTGQILASRAVANSANNDIGSADKTYQDNANVIDAARKQYQTQANTRDAALQSSLNTDNENAHNTAYQQILNAANSAGDKATYAKYLPQLVQSSAPTQQIIPQTVLHNAADVNSYAPTSGLRVTSQAPANASSTTPVNSALYVKKNS